MKIAAYFVIAAALAGTLLFLAGSIIGGFFILTNAFVR